LGDASIRREIRRDVETSFEGWENLYHLSGGGDNVLIMAVRRDENRLYQGKTLRQIAEMMETDEIDALMELVSRDRSRVETAYFQMSEENVQKQIALPWVSFGSDSPSVAAEGAFLKRSTHPRAYGCFARLLGKYVRDERVIPLEEAVRRLARLPADNLGLDRRGRIEEGYFADLVVFDPANIADHATYEQPHQYATGVRDVVVNGRVTLRDGEFAGSLAGRALYGPGRRD
jgi:N-acyl-D-amino-acid deacylase